MFEVIVAIVISIAGIGTALFFATAKRELERDPEAGVAKR